MVKTIKQVCTEKKCKLLLHLKRGLLSLSYKKGSAILKYNIFLLVTLEKSNRLQIHCWTGYRKTETFVFVEGQFGCDLSKL